MKNLKKFIVIIDVFAILLTLLFACNKPSDNDENNSQKLSVTFIIRGNGGEITTLETTTDKENVHDALVEMKETDKINYEYEMSLYGANPVKLGNIDTTIVPSGASGAYVGFYLDSDNIEYIDITYNEPIEINGKKYNYAGLGINNMPIIDDMTYVFVLASW